MPWIFFSWKQLETNLVTLKSFTCCVTVASGYEPEWYQEGPSSEQPQELQALAGSGMLYYVQSHGNLNLAAMSASEITRASQPSAPVTRVDLGEGCRLRNQKRRPKGRPALCDSYGSFGLL